VDGSVACAAHCLASPAFRRQMSLSDDIRGGSSNAPNREEKPRRSGAKGICGRRVFGLPQRDNTERGGWFQKEKAPPDDGAKDVMHGANRPGGPRRHREHEAQQHRRRGFHWPELLLGATNVHYRPPFGSVLESTVNLTTHGAASPSRCEMLGRHPAPL